MFPIFYFDLRALHAEAQYLYFVVKQFLLDVLLRPRVQMRLRVRDGVSRGSGCFFPRLLWPPASQTPTFHHFPDLINPVLKSVFCVE